MNEDGVRRQDSPAGSEPARASRDPHAGDRVPLHLVVNGAERIFMVRMHDSLLDVLRREGYASVKRVCLTADCGACSVLMDGLVVDSCATLALQAENRSIETIEGLAGRAGLHPLQETFLRHAAVQCGFCIPGMIMTMKALLERRPQATAAEIREAMPLCRCSGYVKPMQATLDYQARLGQAPGSEGP